MGGNQDDHWARYFMPTKNGPGLEKPMVGLAVVAASILIATLLGYFSVQKSVFGKSSL